MPDSNIQFTLLQVEEHELHDWALQQARARGLSAIAEYHDTVLLEATRVTRGHLAALSEELSRFETLDRPDWEL